MPSTMRLDAFLKNSGLIARRPVAKRACDEHLVELGGRPAKAAAPVSVGVQITLRIGMRVTRHEVLALPAHPVSRASRDEYVRLISTELVELDT